MRLKMRFSSVARSASNPASIRMPSTMSSSWVTGSSVSGRVRAASAMMNASRASVFA